MSRAYLLSARQPRLSRRGRAKKCRISRRVATDRDYRCRPDTLGEKRQLLQPAGSSCRAT